MQMEESYLLNAATKEEVVSQMEIKFYHFQDQLLN